MAKQLSTESNLYTILYATVIVVIVAVLLAVVSQVLSPRQTANKRLDTQKQILVALNQDVTTGNPAALYDQIVEEQTMGDKQLFVAHVDGATKYVLPLKGQGLWGKLAVMSPLVVARKSLKVVEKGKGKYIPGFWN